ncbi:MAG: extracellular solute-binding protein [Planctomycetes bacterium]|nr:extracellular solute-binding protein [Planctomycetota bacterium]
MEENSSTVGDVQIPLHRRIAENLSNQVSNGKLKPGERLPSERQIARQFQASRATVRTALQHLEQAGLITRRERRSAVVSIRRDIAPFLRIACSNPRLIHLFSRLDELQLLPPRCQLQLCDLQQVGSLGRLVSQPSTATDMLIFDLEHTNLFKVDPEQYQSLPRRLWSEWHVSGELQEIFFQDGSYFAAPLSITPQVLFFNRAHLRDGQVEIPPVGWQWDQFMEIVQRLTVSGRYGFQFRPSFNHLAEIILRRGGSFYQADGIIAANSCDRFEETIRFIHDLVHVYKVSPILAKADQINLFADNRCAMALDGFEMYNFYKEKLGDNLGITVLPKNEGGCGILSGFGALSPSRQEESQPVHDLLRALLSTSTQRTFIQIGGGMPVRADLLNVETLESLGIERDGTQIFLNELKNCKPASQPFNVEHKRAVENLFLETWLGLDNIESICRRFKELN